MAQKEKILLVEDNKTLAKLLAKKLEKTIGVLVDVAYTMAEARAFINAGNNYFISLLDLNLPDAPNGEIVDFILSHDILALILTGSIDEETKKKFIDKDIVDYVFKGNMNDVNYIFTTIERLFKNRHHKVMIVDDSMPMRNSIKKILESQQFEKIYVAAHGEEALNYFENNPDIKLIITDSNMPVINGLELTARLRETHDKNELVIIGLTSDEDTNISSAFLKTGANDFIRKPFLKEELVTRINSWIEHNEHIEYILNMANVDYMTGAFNRRYFFSHAEDYIKQAESDGEHYALAMIDIDFFKKINDIYGHQCGDEVIKFLANILKNETKGLDVVSRFGGEEFCVLLKNISKEDAVRRFVAIRSKIENNPVVCEERTINFTASIGVAFNQIATNLNELIEQADKALYDAKNNGRNRVEIYEDDY